MTFGVLVGYFFYSWSFAVLTNQVFRVLTALSYLTIFLMLLGVIASLSGFRQILHTQRAIARKNAQQTSISLLAEILGEPKYKSASILAATGYALFYATVSSIIIYRPMENFAQDYLATIPSVVPIVCCDQFAFTPLFAIYLTEHLGLLIIPANLLILIAVSSLVGLNASLALYAFVHRPRPIGAQWLGGLGAIVGLFTACPTCAGLFLANMIQEGGGIAIASALAKYQPVFVVTTIPLLLASIFLSIRVLRITGPIHVKS